MPRVTRSRAAQGSNQPPPHIPASNSRGRKAGKKSGVPMFTSDQTNKILAALVQHDPWNKPHGQKQKAWESAVQSLNESPAFGRAIDVTTLRDKIRACIELHQGESPARTAFSHSDGFIYHSQIDHIRGLIEKSQKNKQDRKEQKDAQASRAEREGHRARAAALTTFSQAIRETPAASEPTDEPGERHPETTTNNHPIPDTSSEPEGAERLQPDSHPLHAVLAVLQQANRIESERFERLLGALNNLAESVNALARSQAESNTLIQQVLLGGQAVVSEPEVVPSA